MIRPVLQRCGDASHGHSLAVLSPLWPSPYFGAPIDGSTLHIGAVVYTIIGVAPERFVGLWSLRPPAAYIPMATYAASVSGSNWASNYGTGIGVEALARRKPGVSIDAASADLTNALTRSYRTMYAGDASEQDGCVRPAGLAASVMSAGPNARMSRRSRPGSAV